MEFKKLIHAGRVKISCGESAKITEKINVPPAPFILNLRVYICCRDNGENVLPVCVILCDLLPKASVNDLGCIFLVKSKIGLLREIARILFCERNKKSEKGLIAD